MSILKVEHLSKIYGTSIGISEKRSFCL